MPPAQSEEFREACERAGVTVELVILPDAKHGGAEFYDEARLQAVADFLQRK
jgi:dipeptidyl aminopeptidase/acylaminoacyl peptidase